MISLHQCPGCWSFGLYQKISDGWLECDCGEVLQPVDLREPDIWALRMGPPKEAA